MWGIQMVRRKTGDLFLSILIIGWCLIDVLSISFLIVMLTEFRDRSQVLTRQASQDGNF
jgi:hypothetical protein